MRYTELALRRPVTTVMTFVALALVGLLASRLLPLEQFPDIDFPGIFIQIPYPGSTPEEVERRITRPIEEALATLSGVERWRPEEKRALVRLVRAKGGRRESEYIARFNRHRRLRRGLLKLAVGER